MKYSAWAGFCVQTAIKVIRKVQSLNGKGTQVVEQRQAGYREIDPEIIEIDKTIENLILSELKKTRHPFIVLTEEAGRLEFGKQLADNPETLYFICDPIDGSALYRRQIPAFWLTAFGIWDKTGKPVAGLVANLITGQIDFADSQHAYTAVIKNNKVCRLQTIQPSSVTRISDAYVETYLMKPPCLYRGSQHLKSILEPAKFILPNGGPGGYSDVAKGAVDIYLAHGEALTEIFPGLPVALAAGAIVQTFDGKQVQFRDDIHATYDVICCANPTLMQKVKRALHKA